MKLILFILHLLSTFAIKSNGHSPTKQREHLPKVKEKMIQKDNSYQLDKPKPALVITISKLMGVKMKVKKNKDESGKLYNMILKSQTNNDKACGTEELSETRKRNMQSIVDEWTRQNDKTTTSSTNFEVYFHVIHDGSRGNLSDSNIIDSIRVLNNGFSGYVSATCIEPEGEDDEVTIDDCFGPTGGGQLQETIDYIIANTPFFSNEKSSQVNEKRRMETSFTSNSVELSTRAGNTDLGISFTLKGITRTNDANFFENIDSNTEYKTYLRQGDCRTLNIYSGASQYLGWSRYPDQCSKSMIDDGVVINYQTVPGGEDSTNNEGHTLTHEVGHWMGLYHTHEGECDESNPGDYVQDTPRHTETSTCRSELDTCPNDPGNDPVGNFMGASRDCCMESFTDGQITRMKAMIDHYRS